MATSSTLFCIVVAALCFIGVNGKELCDSPQYLELGKTCTINCLFQDNFFGVLWYNTTEYTTTDPLVDYHGLIKSGKGYTSGEFDVDTSGSLVIKRVSLEHESTFIVAYIYSEEDVPTFISVEVVVIVKPAVPFPVFDDCGNTSNVCYASVIDPSLYCTLSFVRPAVPLHVVARTVRGDRNLTNTTTITPQGDGYTSRVISTDIFKFSKLLVLLVCKASTLPGILEDNESFLLAQSSNISLSSMDVIVRYIEQNSKIKLSCADINAGFIVWKKASSFEDKASEVLMYSLNSGEQFTKVFADDVALDGNASLVLSVTKVQQSGYYYCLFGNGVKDGAKLYEVVVLVHPFPAYPVIDDCDLFQNCILEAAQEGSLTCSIYGIHPKVQLKWQTFSKDDAPAISFSNHTLTAKNGGQEFNVTLTSSFILNDKARDRLTIECKVTSPKGVPFHSASKIDLLFEDADVHPTKQPDNSSERSSFVWMIAILVFFLLLTCLLVLGVTYKKCVYNRRNSCTEEEQISSIIIQNQRRGGGLSDLKDLFLKQIKGKYKDWYDAVQPIPYIKDRLYCVDKVFVEGGMEFLDPIESVGGRWTWKTLGTYENVFKASQVSSPRRILEGEPGYGKSTVTLQFAYDWCNPKPTSVLKDVEILILLRLRQLGGVPSIYKAIKRFILPRDTTISETDIEHILRNSKSVVVILDGFDEYPDQDSTTITDVMAIIDRQMFQDFGVVTTTRSSFLPKKYPPSTKRIRLTGFDNKARRYYIRKAVVGDDDEGVRKIEGYLEDNPILSDLCQVPLLFVLFAHMTYESEQFRKLNSVTSFFRYMISCFHSHMRNKMEDENVRKYELFETSHQNLDKLAFEAFSEQSQRIIWDKDEMCHLVGQQFYDQYIRIGILVEEEVIGIIDDPGTPITEHVQYKTEVRFYHKLFCEWYAAHYLTDCLQQNSSLYLSEFLRHLDPFDVQYLYRFACGISSDSAKKIIEYIKNIEGGDKLAILCILEQTGKIDNIKETIRQLCDVGVVISDHDTLFLQRSSMQLLEIAARLEISVEKLYLYNCLQSVDLSTAAIRTTSGIALTSRIPFKELEVALYNRYMTKDEGIGILQFASMCPSLKMLGFHTSLPFQFFKVDSTLSTLKARGVRVWWWMLKEDCPRYILNLETGRWEREKDGEEPTPEEFENMGVKFTESLKLQQNSQNKTEDYFKSETQRIRKKMRKKAEQRQNKDGKG